MNGQSVCRMLSGRNEFLAKCDSSRARAGTIVRHVIVVGTYCCSRVHVKSINSALTIS